MSLVFLLDTNNDQQTGLDPDLSVADIQGVSGCTPQLEFDASSSIATNVRITISESLQAASDKEKFQRDNRNRLLNRF